MRRLLLLTIVVVLFAACDSTTSTTLPGGSAGPGESTTTTTTTTEPWHPSIDRAAIGEPWGDTVEGLLTFRGNPTHSFFGTGPIPTEEPEIVWTHEVLCGLSTDLGVTSSWCGNGWTGQPALWVRDDGVTELMGGAYDHQFHFLDAATGEPTRTPIRTGDIVKGSPTIDPDGFPLVYFGSRDNKLRIVALDRDEAEVIWDVEACVLDQVSGAPSSCPPASDRVLVEGRWNDDWDPAPRIIDDIMYVSGENSIFYIWKLNRGTDASGRVTVAPELLVSVPAYDDDFLARTAEGCRIEIRCDSTSIESSPVFFEGRVYFGTSGGRVMGLDITNVEAGEAPVVFDYWVGDDVDASIVVDEDGMLYVPVEWKRFNERGRELGQLVKLDPYTSGDPYIWGMFSITEPPTQGGLWATPVIGDGVVYVASNKGYLVVVDQETGEEFPVEFIGERAWSSPVLIDDVLLVATRTGELRAYDVTNPRVPDLLWAKKVGTGELTATPAVWDGTIYIWSSDAHLYALR